MARQGNGFVGRRAELTTLAAVTADISGPAPLFVLSGDRGAGKSATLSQLGRRMREGNTIALGVPCKGPLPPWDRYGVTLLVAAIRSGFESFAGRPRLSEAVDAVVRQCREEAYSSPWARYRLLNAVGALFARLGGTRRVVLLLDDADRLAEPEAVLTALQRFGRPVVAACTPGGPVAGRLTALADTVVELGPLTGEESERLLRKAAGAQVDIALREAVRSALGPHWGNPGTLLSTVADLRRRGRLAPVCGAVCLREPDRAIALAPDHHLLATVSTFGAAGRDLVLLAAGRGGLDIDGLPVLAMATGGSPTGFTRRADSLVHAGVLHTRTPGRLTCTCPALAASVVEQAGADRVTWLHRMIARQLLDTHSRYSRPISILAEHVAAAGQALSPRPELVGLLRDDEVRLQPFDRQKLIAHRYASWWHTEPGPERDRTEGELVRLLACSGDPRGLAGLLLGQHAGSGETHAAGAALVSLCEGTPDSAASSAGDDVGRGPASVVNSWLCGDPVVFDDVRMAFGPLALQPGDVPGSDVGVEAACASGDLVPALELVLGADFRLPAHGPLTAYHRVYAGYTDGEWDEALSAAREVELDPASPEPLRTRARLLAAEMCGWRGDERGAAAWLDKAKKEAASPLAVWAALGPGGVTSEDAEAGWHNLRAGADLPDEAGVLRLLTRLLLSAAERREALWSRRLRTEADARHQRFGTAWSAEVAALAHALAEGDRSGLRAAVERARSRGDRFGLAAVCLAVGRIVEEPEGLLTEAYGIAQDLGASKLTAAIRLVMAERGMTAPVVRVRSLELSEIEVRIVGFIRQGRTNRQIAGSLQMSEKTVEKYLTRLYSKVGCRNRYGLATSDLDGWTEQVGA
ncbi:hypothetical protein DMC64_37235 [Amycolatopsis sp. WAC 04197]|uniref:helix-turn-helix transcriptional regulator n=1 Tax=Amycolatopsis sp. WAC 04197 TaxID=2203199 RepID=UPI000F7B7EBB|nr:LuxR family transcriptional regulator [Amycolatopsis sp. WAC 04197]RSN39713.1 hypothetical protein DMC64_37235 [Amycolatopsis sp. WAC 04197]